MTAWSRVLEVDNPGRYAGVPRQLFGEIDNVRFEDLRGRRMEGGQRLSPDPVDGMGGYLSEGLRMREGPASGPGRD